MATQEKNAAPRFGHRRPGIESRLPNAPRAVAVGFNMIDGMITATAVVATMALIHNNAGDFESFRSCYLDAHPNGSQCGAAGVDPVCIAGMKLARSEEHTSEL